LWSVPEERELWELPGLAEKGEIEYWRKFPSKEIQDRM
jgi:hypothetical protein